jgi:putative ABC transport system ATP-binding protein
MVTHENDIAAWARRVVRLRDGMVESDIRNDSRTNMDLGSKRPTD